MRFARPVGLLLSAAAVVLWAIGMTVLQPLTEPIGPWSENLPGNNAYWARDLRFMAIMAVTLGLVLAGRGQLRWSGPAVLLGGCWVAGDVAIDRSDPTGVEATVLLAVGGCAVLGVLAAFLLWQDRGTPPATDRKALTGAACVAGVLTLVAAGIESPTDREPELNQGALATAALLVVLAVGAALAAAPQRSRARVGLAAGLAVVAVLGAALVRADPPGERALQELALGTVLLTGVTLVAWDWPGGRPIWRHHALAALAALVGPAAFLLATAIPMMILLPIGAAFTALAGNSPINAADSDLLISLCGLLSGLAMALLLAWPSALGYRPGPPR
ncbi:hypothetical protein [Micromonospora parathelypteridis]|uniref:Uncharacterized protein n=1 Tax=Micromonospora parathelypteridis TaxID=1839617 RepID=A0A840VQC0_9ACTN|nr:hypothetical protein [Micromonospora parathelypteridis]MBB5479333.1 hypothetical protein [Micromonospora parathelypteridis]GGO01803.1 hypothetical protein GCM10011576_00650 [Micromonospora parathelypteridis]